MGQPFFQEGLREFSKMGFLISGGGDDVTAGARFDASHNFYTIINGTKTFYLAPPEDAAALYYGYRPAFRWATDERGMVVPFWPSTSSTFCYARPSCLELTGTL